MLQHFLKVPPEAMQLANTEARYGALSRALHWATAICVVVVWLLAQFMGDFPKGVVRDSAFATHIALGNSSSWCSLCAFFGASLIRRRHCQRSEGFESHARIRPSNRWPHDYSWP
jgi:cytochrome b subunit of formate dehydrogenase